MEQKVRFEKIPDAFTFANGTEVVTKEDWEKRREEIKNLYQSCMYGIWHSGEEVDYEELPEVVTGHFEATDWNDFSTFRYVENVEPASKTKKSIKIKIKASTKATEGEENDPATKASFRVNLFLPEEAQQTHPLGAPLFIEIGSLSDPVRQYLLAQGYAVAELRTAEVASDDDKRNGAFYALYPYGKSPKRQTGVLMAWAWGVSKLIDVITLPGVSAKYGLDSKVLLVNGVSRNGKAAAVAGAFDRRITVTVPSSSGAGGLVLFRYQSEGLRFDYRPLKREEFVDFLGETEGNASYEHYQSEENCYVTVTTNQSFSHLGVDSMGGWVIDAYRDYSDLTQFPLDQHLLGALVGEEGRYLFITSEVVGGDWVNTPGTYACYLEIQKIFQRLGFADHCMAHIHAVGHAFTHLDAEYLIAFCEQKIYGRTDASLERKLSELKDCIYEQGTLSRP